MSSVGSRDAPCAVLVLLCLCVAEAEAAGGVSIFALGTMIDEYHWDIMFMYYIVFFVTLLLEITVHHLHTSITNHSGIEVIRQVIKQLMILGGISALLVVFENLGGASLLNGALFRYVHFVIFMMAILFITLVTSLFVTVGPRWASWARFEAKVVEIESDPSLCDQDRTAFLAAYVKTVKHGNAMLSCLSYFRSNLPFKFYQISFSRYMKKMQRKIMLTFLDLKWKAWTALALLTSLAAITTWITVTISKNPLATIGLWVLIVGFGPLILLVVLAAKVRYEFHQFAIDVQEMRQWRRKKLPADQSSYFWRTPTFNIELIQIILLYQVFYMATVVVNFSYRLWLYGKEADAMGRSAVLIVLCFAPSVVVFAVVLPRMLPNFTVLASVGEYIDHNVLIGILNTDKRTGKTRRAYRRDKNIIDIAPLMRVDVCMQQDPPPPPPHSTSFHPHPHTRTHTAELLLSQENAGGADVSPEGDEKKDMLPMFKKRDEKDDMPEVEPEERDKLCDNCDEQPASVKCNRCGLLCDDCDMSYHGLRHLKNHARRLFDDALQPGIPTSNLGLSFFAKPTATLLPRSAAAPAPAPAPAPVEPPPAAKRASLQNPLSLSTDRPGEPLSASSSRAQSSAVDPLPADSDDSAERATNPPAPPKRGPPRRHGLSPLAVGVGVGGPRQGVRRSDASSTSGSVAVPSPRHTSRYHSLPAGGINRVVPSSPSSFGGSGMKTPSAPQDEWLCPSPRCRKKNWNTASICAACGVPRPSPLRYGPTP